MAQRAPGSPGVTGEMGSTEALRGAMRPRSPSQLRSKGPRQGHRSSLKALGGVCFSAEVVATLLQDDPHGGLFVVKGIGGDDGMDRLALRIREQGAGPRGAWPRGRPCSVLMTLMVAMAITKWPSTRRVQSVWTGKRAGQLEKIILRKSRASGVFIKKFTLEVDTFKKVSNYTHSHRISFQLVHLPFNICPRKCIPNHSFPFLQYPKSICIGFSNPFDQAGFWLWERFFGCGAS